jgi:aminopeptidase 2
VLLFILWRLSFTLIDLLSLLSHKNFLFTQFYDRYVNSLNLFGKIIKHSIEMFASEEDITDIENFFKGQDTKPILRPLQQGIESIRSNAVWLNRDAKDVRDWLGSHGYLVV